MPLEIACPSCEGQFRVPDSAAGKKIRCPKCKGAIDVPAAPAPAPQPPAAPPPSAPPPSASKPSAPKPRPKPEQWYLKTEEGEEYGPVSREELEGWKEEGRITADCQVLRAGSGQWQWASDVYHDLTPGEAAANDTVAEEEAAAEQPAPVRAASKVKETASAATKSTAKSTAKTTTKPAKKPVPAPVETPEDEGPPSSRSRLVAGLLGIFLGPLGTHRFYLGYWVLGLVMLLTGGGCGIWSLVDAILVLMGRVRDADGRPLSP